MNRFWKWLFDLWSAGPEVIGESEMSDIIRGAVYTFTVAFVNSKGEILSTPVPSDAAAFLSRADGGTAAVNVDGSAGAFTAGVVDGPVDLTASAGGFTSPAVSFNVIQDPADTVPAGVVIVPDVAGVVIVP